MSIKGPVANKDTQVKRFGKKTNKQNKTKTHMFLNLQCKLPYPAIKYSGWFKLHSLLSYTGIAEEWKLILSAIKWG